MKNIVIIVQNLKLGGFQRIALDEAYDLSLKGFRVTLLLLEEIAQGATGNFFYSESDLIQKFNIQVVEATGNRKRQLIFFKTLLKTSSSELVFISHNLRATVLIRLACVLVAKKIKITTVIHQLPSLSDSAQRMKRFLYARLSDNLFIFSAAALKDWNERINSNLFLKMLYKGQNVELLRNGIFFGRINDRPKLDIKSESRELRLIFLGRPTFWKGIGTVLELANTEHLLHSKVIFFLPYADDSLFQNLPESLTNRLEIIVGKTFRDYVPRLGDVHLYPADYGSSNFIEAISINCLEMAAVGVPSCVTKGGLVTWPEFLDNPIITEIDWLRLNEAAKSILACSQIRISELQLQQIRDLISIKNHTNRIMENLAIG